MTFERTEQKERIDWPHRAFVAIFDAGAVLAVVYLIIIANHIFHILPGIGYVKHSIWPIDTDFLNYWTAARLAIADRAIDIFNPEAFRNATVALTGHVPVQIHSWPYSPLPLVFMSWLGALPYKMAFCLWMVLTFILYAASVAVKRPDSWKVVGVLALAPATFMNVMHGQGGFLTAACLVGGLRLMDKRPVLAGALFGLLTFKPHLLLLMPFILFPKDRRRVLVSAVATTAVLFVVSLACFGPMPWIDYFQKIVPYQKALMEFPPAADKYMMNSVFITLFAAVRRLSGSLDLAYFASLVSATAGIGATLYVVRRRMSADLRDAVILTALFITTPYGLIYDTPILVAAIVSFLAAARAIKTTALQAATAAILFLFPLMATQLNAAGLPLGPVLAASFLVVCLQTVSAGQRPEKKLRPALQHAFRLARTEFRERKILPKFVYPVLLCVAAYYLIDAFKTIDSITTHIFTPAPDGKKMPWPENSDFLTLWSAAKLMAKDQLSTLFDASALFRAQEVLSGYKALNSNNWPYSPLPLLYVRWLEPFSVRDAFLLWEGITFAFYALAVAYRRPDPWKLTILLAAAPATAVNLGYGQSGYLMAALLIGGLRLMDKRPILAGILFGVLTYKPQFMILLPFVLLAQRRWKVLISSVVMTAGLHVLSVALYGVEPWVIYFNKIVPFQTMLFDASPIDDGFKMNSTFVTLFAAVRNLGGSLALSYGLSALAAVAGIAGTIYACRKNIPSDLRDAVIVSALFLSTPYAHVYDFPILMGAVVSYLMTQKASTITIPQIALFWGLCILPFHAYPMNRAHQPISPLLFMGFFYICMAEIYRIQNGGKRLIDLEALFRKAIPLFGEARRQCLRKL